MSRVRQECYMYLIELGINAYSVIDGQQPRYYEYQLHTYFGEVILPKLESMFCTCQMYINIAIGFQCCREFWTYILLPDLAKSRNRDIWVYISITLQLIGNPLALQMSLEVYAMYYISYTYGRNWLILDYRMFLSEWNCKCICVFMFTRISLKNSRLAGYLRCHDAHVTSP